MTASEETAEVVDAALAEDLPRRLTAAWNSHRAEQVVVLTHPDVLWEDPSIPGGHLVGQQALKDWMQSLWRAVPDMTISENGPAHIAVDGRSVMVEWTLVGTFSGPMNPPGLAPTNQQIRISGTDRYWFRGGLLGHVRTVTDMMSLARQIGASPAEGSRAEKLLTAGQRLTARWMRRRSAH